MNMALAVLKKGPTEYTDTVSHMKVQLATKFLDPPDFHPLLPMVNKLCSNSDCGNKMHQIVPNMMLSQYLEVKLSLL